MDTVFKTTWGTALEIALKYNIAPNIPNNSTLNKALDIGDSLTLAPGDTPHIKYLAIGTGGKTLDCSSTPSTTYSLYNVDQAKLYKHVPFILRPINNDLTPAEANKYRMRKVISVGGNDYVAYYLMVIDTSTLAIEFETTVIPANAPKSSTPYVPGANNLTPTPPTSAEITAANNTYINAHADVSIFLSETTVEGIKDATAIINGGVADDYITELALVSGVDKSHNISINGATVNYTELAKAQLNEIIRVDKSLIFGNPELTMTLSAGSLDPLYG